MIPTGIDWSSPISAFRSGWTILAYAPQGTILRFAIGAAIGVHGIMLWKAPGPWQILGGVLVGLGIGLVVTAFAIGNSRTEAAPTEISDSRGPLPPDNKRS